MAFPYEEFDLSGVTTYPLASRPSKAHAADFGRPAAPGATVSALVASLPNMLAGADLLGAARHDQDGESVDPPQLSLAALALGERELAGAVRRALEGMCQDGLLDRLRGRAGGTFVAQDWDTVVAVMHDPDEAASLDAVHALLDRSIETFQRLGSVAELQRAQDLANAL